MGEFITKDSGERAQFESGMQRDTEAGKPRFDLMLPLDIPYEDQMITRLAALYGRGAVKYDSRNWEKANSEEEMARMKSSAFRHFMQWMAGESDEDHAAGAMFNIIAHETTKYKVDRQPAPEREYTEAEVAAIADEILGVEHRTPAPARPIPQPSEERPPYVDNSDQSVETERGLTYGVTVRGEIPVEDLRLGFAPPFFD